MKQVLDVDRELQPHAVKRTLEVQGSNLIAFVPPRNWYLSSRTEFVTRQETVDLDDKIGSFVYERIAGERRPHRSHVG